MPVDKVRGLIIAIDDNRTKFSSPPYTPFISKRLRNLVGISEPINEKESINELKQQMKDEFKQQMKDMQELLNSLVRNLNANNDKINE
jgi:hypothetical protein